MISIGYQPRTKQKRRRFRQVRGCQKSWRQVEETLTLSVGIPNDRAGAVDEADEAGGMKLKGPRWVDGVLPAVETGAPPEWVMTGMKERGVCLVNESENVLFGKGQDWLKFEA